MTAKSRTESTFERLMFRSRWLMAPFYVGLVVMLALLLVRFMVDLFETIVHIPGMDDKGIVLASLKMIDMSLVGNLLLVVIFAGYENFVSKMDSIEVSERAIWMGKVDFSGIKIKLIGSIVAISAIHLLETFLDIHDESRDDLMWKLALHVVFITSGVVLALMDRLSVSKSIDY